MEVFLVVAAAVAGTGVLGAVTTGVWMRTRLDRSLRLVPGRRTAVPWRWRWSPGRAAVLHRRLQRSCQVVIAATGGPSAWRTRRAGLLRRHRAEDTSVLRSTARDLLARAVRLDDRLVAVERGGAAWRRLHLPALAEEVRTVEASCLRLARLAGALDAHLDAVTGKDSDDGADTVLDAMEAAIADLQGQARPAPRSTALP